MALINREEYSALGLLLAFLTIAVLVFAFGRSSRGDHPSGISSFSQQVQLDERERQRVVELAATYKSLRESVGGDDVRNLHEAETYDCNGDLERAYAAISRVRQNRDVSAHACLLRAGLETRAAELAATYEKLRESVGGDNLRSLHRAEAHERNRDWERAYEAISRVRGNPAVSAHAHALGREVESRRLDEQRRRERAKAEADAERLRQRDADEERRRWGTH